MANERNGNIPAPKEPPRKTSLEDDLESRRITHIDVTEGIRSMLIDDNGSSPGSNTPRSSTPRSNSNSRLSPSRPQSIAEEVTQGGRPKLSRKAATAPAGLLQTRGTIPQPPRRAISARPARPGQNGGDQRQRPTNFSPLLPRISYFGTAPSRSTISRRKDSRKSSRRTGSKPKIGIWRKTAPRKMERYARLAIALQEQDNEERNIIWDIRQNTPFSERPRVKQTLKEKNVKLLDTNIVDFNQRNLPDTPMSMVDTPREMYGTPPDEPGNGPFAFPFEWGEKMAKLELPPRKEYHLKQPVSPDKARHLSLPLTPDMDRQGAVRRISSVQTMRPQEGGLWKTHVYIPGPIRLEDKYATISLSTLARKGSMAMFEPFGRDMDDQQRKLSDDVALENIIRHFHDLGVVDVATEAGMDKFWEESEEATIQGIIRRPSPYPKARIRLGLNEPPLPPWPSSQSPPLRSLPSVQEDPKQTPCLRSPKSFRNSDDKASSPSLLPGAKLRRFFRSSSSLPKG
ncbi:hypothetical protein P154DRAFT_538449 [Amniculicola lignicola CBS 123094]|uniref:Uncharacterized protein n=1 Tax=Amniculicola lignicola CBS 123094 TaxID=1392246 RepID=A0A6A5W4Q1_9PLEO|nr:hypothetical protein P154DRAFT_538449 [Amniculicola lignicola CBS 123094]